MKHLSLSRAALMKSLDRSPLWQEWRQLSPRDRGLLLLLGGFVMLVLFYALIYKPLGNAVERSREYQQEQRALFTYIQSNASRVQGGADGQLQSVAVDQLQGIVISSAQKRRVAIERYDAEGDGGIVVNLTNVPFKATMEWLADLDDQGVVVGEAYLDKGGSGNVDARLVLTTLE